MWVVFLFIFGFVVPGINNWGHGGGILAGIGLGFLLGYQEKRRENLFHKMLAGTCALVTLLVLGWAVSTAVYYNTVTYKAPVNKKNEQAVTGSVTGP